MGALPTLLRRYLSVFAGAASITFIASLTQFLKIHYELPVQPVNVLQQVQAG